MELRHLRYFIAVAEQLNFRKAAELLHVSQPPLSAQIRDLEDEIGAKLLDRTNRRVSLTPEGRVFLQHAYQVLEQVSAAKCAVGKVGRGEEGELRVGFTQSCEFLMFVPATIFRFRELYPNITLALHELSSQAQVDAIADRKLDLGIGRMPKGRPSSAALFTKLYSDRLVLAVHCGNALARRSSVAIADLAGCRFIMHRPRHDSGLYRRVLDLCQEEGFIPVIAQEASEVTTCVALVASGLGVAVVPSSMQCIQFSNVIYLPLTGSGADVPLYIISLKGERNGFVSVFQKMLLEAAAS